VLTSLKPIIPAVRREPFDDAAWLFDLKLDGFRGLADTIADRMLSKNDEAVRGAARYVAPSLCVRWRDRRVR